jgi:predicted 3-demethylubiquinone-9 3-methyltransferase (glyoxalase superfamily)
MPTTIRNPKITPCLWYDRQADEAARFYCSLFADSGIVETLHYGPDMHLPEGTVLTVDFRLAGQRFVALNAGPGMPFSDAVSLQVECDDQAEVDRLWAALTADGGTPVQCGWLRDRYGLAWQIAPRRLLELIKSPDKAAVGRVFQALMPMVKLDLAALEAAARGR